MLRQSSPNLPLRHNADGSYDAICTQCFQTVASVLEESDLAAFENAHVCDPKNQFAASQTRLTLYQPLKIQSAQVRCATPGFPPEAARQFPHRDASHRT